MSGLPTPLATATAEATAASAAAAIEVRTKDISPSSFPDDRQADLECDYDLNPSYLYQAIEARQWESASDYLNKKGDAVDSETDVESATWVTRKETNGKLRWRLLPIHAAVIFKAPLDFVELLLSEYPAGAQCKDDQGMLPLHLAFRNAADWEVLEELLTAYPQAIRIKDRKERTPLQCASSQGKRPASVIDLYTQITLASERTKIVQEANAGLDDRITTLQDAHVKTLATLKNESELQLSELSSLKNVRESQIDELKEGLVEAQAALADKDETERELTSKLEQVATALQVLTELRAAEEAAIDKNAVNRVNDLMEANTELTAMVQGLLNQQISLKVSLDQQSWESTEKADELESVLTNIREKYSEKETETNKERDSLRDLLGDSNDDVSKRLAKVLKISSESGGTADEAAATDETQSLAASELLKLERTHRSGSSVTDEKKEGAEDTTALEAVTETN